MDGEPRTREPQDRDVPRDDPEARERGERNRKQMDDIPPHGTDPLHEGP